MAGGTRIPRVDDHLTKGRTYHEVVDDWLHITRDDDGWSVHGMTRDEPGRLTLWLRQAQHKMEAKKFASIMAAEARALGVK